MAEKKKLSKRVKRLIRLLTALVVVAGLGTAGYFGVTSLQEEYTVDYIGYTAAVGSISNSLNFSGSLALINSESYAATTAGTVKQVYAAAGDKVKAGDKLVRLSTGETIKADFDGTINLMNVKKDDKVSAGQTLCQLADFDHMSVSVKVDEYDIGSVKVGDQCRVTVTATEQRFPSAITRIDHISSSTGNVAYYTATCEVDVSGGVYPGMQVTVTVPQESAENVVVLKADALSFDLTNSAYVMMYDSAGELARVDVEVGVSNGNYVEIKSGVQAGETVYAEAGSTAAGRMTQMMEQMFGSTNVVGTYGGSWDTQRLQDMMGGYTQGTGSISSMFSQFRGNGGGH